MLQSAALSEKGCVRSNNEDCCLIKSDLGLFVLADGMGGAKAGERASQIAVETVAEIVEHAPHRDSQTLLLAVEEANRRVLDAARSDADAPPGGHRVSARGCRRLRSRGHARPAQAASARRNRACP